MRQTIWFAIKQCFVCQKNTRGAHLILVWGFENCLITGWRISPYSKWCWVNYTETLHVKEGVIMIKVYIILFTCCYSSNTYCVSKGSDHWIIFLEPLDVSVEKECILTWWWVTIHSIVFQQQYFLGISMKILQWNTCRKQKKGKWHFIPVWAPCFEAIWKRGLGILKSGLKKVLRWVMVLFDEYLTILVELEAIVNDHL